MYVSVRTKGITKRKYSTKLALLVVWKDNSVLEAVEKLFGTGTQRNKKIEQQSTEIVQKINLGTTFYETPMILKSMGFIKLKFPRILKKK